VRLADKQPVVIKTPRDEYPTLRSIARVRHEYSVLSELNAPGIVRVYDLIPYDKSIALVEEYFAGLHMLQYFREKRPDLGTSLRIAINIASAVMAYHDHGIIHRDLTPFNILIGDNAETKIIDFDIASRLARESQGICNPVALEGTLAYMAPEQTGRMNRDIDLRADLYSFGVTLYEALAGRHPFPVTDPMELLHCHIAREPEPLHLVNRAIPVALSAIISTLMAKTAEARYQSAYGIKIDLENCLRQLTDSGTILAFRTAQYDDPSQLRIPQKLYGRSTDQDSPGRL
jgi:serine/threonine protein kinase